MPLQATSGAASYDAFGGGVPVAANYIEDVFSTWLYTGNGSTQTITTGVDTGTKGGLIWVKMRDASASHCLFDSARASGSILSSNTTDAATPGGSRLALTATGFDLQSGGGGFNQSGSTYASWTFREQPKFFDVVTYTGNGTAGRTVAHNLGSVPGCIIIKKTSDTENWGVYHRSLGNTASLALNLTNASGSGFWNNTTPTDAVFTLGNQGQVNDNGQTYVAYLFAHNAGGFGLTGTDNVISCGSYTGNGSTTGPEINLGYEPQWVMVKNTTTTGTAWRMFDNMRGFTTDGVDNALAANSSAAEVTYTAVAPTATGFRLTGITSDPNRNGDTYIYIAIRRGPMKTPTTGTSVFTPYEVPASPTTGAITGFVTDAGFIGSRAGNDKFLWGARLMGNPTLNSTSAAVESANTNQIWDRMNGWWNSAINGYMTWGFKRAPGFMDVVCYTGAGAGTIVNHNLTVVPELIISKARSTAASQGWGAFHSFTGSGNVYNYLQSSGAGFFASYGGGSRAFASQPTSTQFVTDGQNAIDSSGVTYVAYLFASCPGVSKVTNFTGTGTLQTINCGFTGGARFVLIKRTDSTGNWFVWDSSRGLSSSNDPYLMLNSAAAEVTSTNWVDTTATGFQVTAASGNDVNINGASYIALAIA